jgi:hypothetical protein
MISLHWASHRQLESAVICIMSRYEAGGGVILNRPKRTMSATIFKRPSDNNFRISSVAMAGIPIFPDHSRIRGLFPRIRSIASWTQTD